MSASVSCVVFAILRRSLPTRRVRSTKSGMSANANSASCQLEQEHADHRRDDRRHARDDRRRGVRDDALDAADVVRDPRLHLARARAREEREREPLQVAEDGRAQVVHHALADLVREQRLADAEHAGDDRDRDHPGRRGARGASCRPGSPDASQDRAGGTPGSRRGRAEKTISARTAASRSLYGLKSAATRRRFARHDRRVGGALGRFVVSKQRPPGIASRVRRRGTIDDARVPITVRLFAGLRERAG